jgi:hypothetical protein
VIEKEKGGSDASEEAKKHLVDALRVVKKSLPEGKYLLLPGEEMAPPLFRELLGRLECANCRRLWQNHSDQEIIECRQKRTISESREIPSMKIPGCGRA